MKTLQSIKKKMDEKATFDGVSPFLQLKDKDSYVIRFLQEMPGEGNDERRGNIVVLDEHQAGPNFKIRAACTLEDTGRCWACEQTNLPEIGRFWKPKMRFYANVIVRTESDGKTLLDEPRVQILAQGFGDKNTGPQLVAYAEEYGTLTNADYKLTRTGAKMNDTSYQLIPKAPTKLSKVDEALEVRDISRYIKFIPYENQAEYYAGAVQEDSAKDW